MTSYEEVLSKVIALEPSNSMNERRVDWLTAASVVGISRTPGGQIEVFLSGVELKPNSRVIRRALEYQTWHRTSGLPSLDANRLLLPAAGHFDHVAAFLCAELIRSGSDTDLKSAFRASEPIIELAITRLRLTDQALLGLTGELVLLDAILRQVERGLVRETVESWLGWRVSTRDFSIGSVGIEVKTTTHSTSSHKVQGVHQLEPQDHSASGSPEGKLFLVSVGIEWVGTEVADAHTLPNVVDSIVARINAAAGESESVQTVGSFLHRVSEYGEEKDLGYDHQSMSKDTVFARRFITRFVRCYDMTDPSIKVLRSGDLIPHLHIDSNSVRFRIQLPASVQGDLNPVVGLGSTATAIIQAGLHD